MSVAFNVDVGTGSLRNISVSGVNEASKFVLHSSYEVAESDVDRSVVVDDVSIVLEVRAVDCSLGNLSNKIIGRVTLVEANQSAENVNGREGCSESEFN